jgi:hypothetical protein
MRHSFGLRAGLIALTVALTGLGLSSSARADSGTISFRVLKGGWFIGASGGSGTLFFHGRSYPLSIGGLSVGLVFGGSETYCTPFMRRAGDLFPRHGHQYPQPARCHRHLRRSRRRRCNRRRGADHRIAQRKGSGVAPDRPAGRIAAQRRPERTEYFGPLAG